MLVFVALPTTSASAETRKLKLYYLHTGERAEITFKKNGRYVKSGLRKINHFLRDWRRNEPTKMNPKLLDLIWEVYKETRSRKHIHVISGYRSPKTNNLLRKRGRGVAKKSQHTLGNALDFFIPGVNLTKLRNIGLKKGLGGVGYYPKSGSPFVHMDTGRVRHWPRMNRSQLARVFPKGKTLHVPTDGKPLPGYNIAKANYERKLKGGSKFQIASAEEIRKKPNAFKRLFGRGGEDEGTIGAVAAPKRVKTKPAKPTVTAKPAAPAVKPEIPVVAPEAAPVPEVPQTPEVIIAALSPNQIPVPVLAPRITIVKPPEPEIVETQETQVASLEPVEELTTQDAPLTESAFTIPVPSQRPTIALAEVIEPTLIPRPTIEVAALSANEITDLRQQVYAELERDVKPDVKKPEPIQIAETIPFKPATPIPNAENTPFSAPTKLEANDLPKLIQSASSAIEKQISPVPPIEPTTRPPALVTALLAPEQKTEVQVDAKATTAAIAVPVPQPALRPTQITKAPKKKAIKQIVTTENKPLSLEEFETANLDERLTGKWALATDASIKDIADIQPPAYGKNVLRQSPTAVLSAGFSQALAGSTNSFTGSSVEFLDFKSFK